MSLGQETIGRPLLRLVVDSGDSQSRMIAVGMSSLANSTVDAFNIDIDLVSFQDNPLLVMRQEDSDLALVNLAEVDSNEFGVAHDLRAVMKAWQDGDQAGKTDSDNGPGYLLIARSGTDAALIKSFVTAVQSDTVILDAANLDTERLAPSIAMIDLPLRLHDGAQDYLTIIDARPVVLSAAKPELAESAGDPVEQEVVTSRLARDSANLTAALDVNGTPPDIDQPERIRPHGQISGARSYTLYFDTDEATVDKGHISSIARANRYAARLPRAKFVISGHTDTAGSMSYNDDLAKRRASVVAHAIRNDPRFRDGLSVVEFGEAKPALKTRDGVSEQMNRRVVITILPD